MNSTSDYILAIFFIFLCQNLKKISNQKNLGSWLIHFTHHLTTFQNITPTFWPPWGYFPKSGLLPLPTPSCSGASLLDCDGTAGRGGGGAGGGAARLAGPGSPHHRQPVRPPALALLQGKDDGGWAAAGPGDHPRLSLGRRLRRRSAGIRVETRPRPNTHKPVQVISSYFSQPKLIHIKPNSTTPNWIYSYQTKLNHPKPNSSIPNQTQPHHTKVIHTKLYSTTPNQTIWNQTEPDNSQLNLTNPNWLGMHSRTISSFCLLLAILLTLAILQKFQKFL